MLFKNIFYDSYKNKLYFRGIDDNGKVEKESLLWFKNALKNGDFSKSGGSRERILSIEALNSHF